MFLELFMEAVVEVIAAVMRGIARLARRGGKRHVEAAPGSHPPPPPSDTGPEAWDAYMRAHTGAPAGGGRTGDGVGSHSVWIAALLGAVLGLALGLHFFGGTSESCEGLLMGSIFCIVEVVVQMFLIGVAVAFGALAGAVTGRLTQRARA